MLTVIQLIILFIIPIIFHNILKDKSISRWISPVVACLGLGIFIGSFIVPKFSADNVEHFISISTIVQGVSIIIAVPLLLLTSNFMAWLPKAQSILKAFFVSWLSVLIASVATFFIYKGLTEDGWMISSMLFAGFTGTNANLNALGYMLECPDDLLGLINLGDLFTGAIYLIILTSIAHPILSKILPKYQHYSKGLIYTDEKVANEIGQRSEDDFSHLSGYKMTTATYLLPILIGILILGASMGLEKLFYGTIGEEFTFLILFATTSGILLSFFPKVRNLKSAYRIGQYLLLVFCIALGTTIDVQDILANGSFVILYTTVLMLITIAFNVGLAYAFKVDADSTLMASAATIFGPAFVGQVAMAMKNREIIFSGMIVSIVGIAISNYTGLMLARILQML